MPKNILTSYSFQTSGNSIAIPGSSGTNALVLNSTVNGASNLINLRFQSANGNLFDLGKNETSNQGGSFYLYTGSNLAIEVYNGATKRLIVETNGNINIGPTTGAGTARLSVFNGAAGTVAQLIRGVASQTADILQVQSSAGTVLGGRNANGQIFSGSTVPLNYQVGGTPTATSGTGSTATINLTTASLLAVGDLIQVTGFTPTAYNTTGYVVVTGVSNSPTFSVSYASTATGTMTVAGQVRTVPQASFTARSTATVPLIVKGNGFNMNLQTWLKSDNNNGIIINPYGSLVGYASANQFNSDNGANYILRTVGVSDQRANHYQVVNSSSTILAGFNGQGQIFTGAAAPIQGSATSAIGTQTPTGTTNISITTGSAHGIVVGQTVVIAGVTPSGYNGTWTAQAGTTGTTLVVNIGSNPGVITVAGVVSQNSQLGVVASSATNTPVVIRGAASQSANLTEWRDSGGNNLGWVTSGGTIQMANVVSNAAMRANGSLATSSVAAISVVSNATIGHLVLQNIGTVPNQPSGGGVLYVETGALKYRGTSGSAITIVNANGTEPLLSSNNTFTGVQAFNNAVNIGGGSVGAVGLEIGSTLGSATTPFIDFHSGATAIDFDSRIIASGGTGTNGAGTLTYTAATNTFTGSVNTAFGLALTGTTSPITLNGSVGTSGQVLTSAGAGATPTWTTVSGGGSFTGGTLTSNLTLAAGTTSLSPLTFQSGTNLTTVTAGANEYDGTVFYQTSNTNPGRALATQNYYYLSNSQYFVDLSTGGLARSLLGGNTTGITLAAGTTYEYEAMFAISAAFVITSQTPTIAITNTTVTGSPVVVHTTIFETGNNTTGFTNAITLGTTRTTGTVNLTALTTGNRYYLIRMRGMIRITGTGSTKIYPSISASASSGDNGWTVESGAMFKLTPIGNGTATTVGTWA
jgi:hypothetical protein